LLVLLGAVAAAAAAEAGAPGAVRLPLALMATLVLPGMALAAVCFPGLHELSSAERGGLAVGLSLALVVMTALALSYTPWGLGFQPMVLGLSGLTVALCMAGWARQRTAAKAGLEWETLAGGELPREHAPAAWPENAGWRGPARIALALAWAAEARMPAFVRAGWAAMRERREREPPGNGLTTPEWLRSSWLAAGALSIVFAIVAGALLSLKLESGRPAAQFYILGPAGLIQDLPVTTTAGQPLGLTLNLDDEAAGTYHVALLHDGALLGQASATLDAGELWRPRVSVTLPAAGDDQRVDVVLSRAGSGEPYRELTLWLNAG
jgi:uncharacterized membrane protein